MKIASYNVENLFERAVALSGDTSAADAEAAIVAQGEINVVLRKPVYDAADRARILELLTALGLRDSDDGSPLVLLRQNRGQLVQRHQNGDVEVVASGRGSWLGWVELKLQAVDEVSTQNTARVISELDADILAVVEAEGHPKGQPTARATGLASRLPVQGPSWTSPSCTAARVNRAMSTISVPWKWGRRRRRLRRHCHDRNRASQRSCSPPRLGGVAQPRLAAR
jgi:hypothetical protein